MNAPSDRRPSYRKVNYVLRPAKNIERKMMCEMLARLSVFAPIGNYRYVGFGSVYFADFSLVHRLLGITALVSIEGNVEDAHRVLFNRPFDCIEVLMGTSSERLQDVPFDRPTIVWLDYDTELSRCALADLDRVCVEIVRGALSGSFIAVTVDAKADRLRQPKSVREEERDEWPAEPVAQLERIIGQRHVPAELTARDLRGDVLPQTYLRILTNAIVNAVNSQNGLAEDADQMEFRQVINFVYADNAKMMTVGWVIFRRGDAELFERCGFARFAFYRSEENAFKISSPNLTYREIRALDQELPNGAADPSNVPVPPEDRGRYVELYRYFPAFVEAEL